VWKLEESYDVGAASLGAREAEYADVEYGYLGALHLHADAETHLMRKILQYCITRERSAAHNSAGSTAAAQSFFADGSELWPVRTVCTKKQPAAVNGSAPMVISMWSF
jgi:hypothetical protein